MNVGRTLVLLGLALVVLGLVWMFGSKLGLGRLPGDIAVEKKNYGFYFPIVSSIVVSLVLTLLLNLFRR